ncbi:MAG: hypothetical protein IPM42_15980 [Saprospiraceae bacterium]|nr:hypothetical protein [Saprospiraceae bacterium]
MNQLIPALFGFFLISLLSCKPTSTSQGPEVTDDVNPEKMESIKSQADIPAIEKFVGKYPDEIKLFDNFGIEPILREMMGEKFNQMKTEWNVETPIESDDRILYTTGCKKSACNDQFYLLIMDGRDNNINVFHFNEGVGRSYEYSGIIGMSEKMAKLFEEIRNKTNR